MTGKFNKEITPKKMKKIQLAIVFVLFVSYFQSYTQVLDPVDWDFRVEQKSKNTATLFFIADIDEGWHIYAQDPNGGRTPTIFSIEESDNFKLIGPVTEPENAIRKYDSIFNMEVSLFDGKVSFSQDIELLTTESFQINGFVEYFSCDDERCLPPEEEDFSLVIGSGENLAIQKVSADETMDSKDKKSAGNTMWGIILLSLIGGFGALLTPCVYPIIPLTVSFFMRGSPGRSRAVFSGVAFGISIILIYTSLGLLAGIFKVDLAKSVATHWIPNIIFFALFIIFAMSFFGMFELVLPGKWANKIDQKADKGGVLGPFFMALATVIISFSCTGPIVGVLLGKSLQGEIIIPVLGMFFFSLAFALPFTLLAIFPGMIKKMPKSGGWLNSVKVVFAFIMLAFGLKFLSNIDQAYHLNILGRSVYLSLWIAIFSMMGLYFLGKIQFSHDSEMKHIGFFRLLLAIITFAFVIYLIPGLFGAELSSISSVLPPKYEMEFDLTKSVSSSAAIEQNTNVTEGCQPQKYAHFLHMPHNLNAFYDYHEALKCAKELNKPLFLDFKGHYCTNCKAMESKVMAEDEILSLLRNEFVIVAFFNDDKTKLPESEWYTSSVDGKVKKTLGKKNTDFQILNYGTNSIPLYAIVDHDGNNLTEPMGYNLDVNVFRRFLEKGVDNFSKKKQQPKQPLFEIKSFE